MNKVEFYTPIFNEFLSKFAKSISGPNFETEMGVLSVDIEPGLEEPKYILEKIFGVISFQNLKISKCTHEHAVKEISKFILIPICDKQPRHYTEQLVVELKNKKIPKLFNHIKNMVSSQESQVFSCAGLPYPELTIFNSFCFLFVDTNSNLAILLYGGASD